MQNAEKGFEFIALYSKPEIFVELKTKAFRVKPHCSDVYLSIQPSTFLFKIHRIIYLQSRFRCFEEIPKAAKRHQRSTITEHMYVHIRIIEGRYGNVIQLSVIN